MTEKAEFGSAGDPTAGTDDQGFRVTDDREAARYELYLEEERVGFADYQLGEGRIHFTYIEVDPALQGRGLASMLTEAALKDAQSRGLSITARCPFIVDYLDTHPEYTTPPA